jgi:hypothetical protein
MKPDFYNQSLECRGYGVTLTPWWCIENQLSDFCLPGFPCHDCEAGVTIIPPAPPLEKGGEIEAEVGRSCADPAVPEASKDTQSGAPSLKRPKTRKVKVRVYDPKTMSRAVARDLWLLP